MSKQIEDNKKCPDCGVPLGECFCGDTLSSPIKRSTHDVRRTVVKQSGMRQVRSLKELQSLLNNAVVEMKSLIEQGKEIENSKKALQETINNLNASIKAYTNSQKDIVVSEHALLRYLLRTQGIDVDKLAKDLVPNSVKAQIKMLGNGTYPIPEKGYKVVVKENVVVTILSLEDKK
jgi:predicted transcriptional regulator